MSYKNENLELSNARVLKNSIALSTQIDYKSINTASCRATTRLLSHTNLPFLITTIPHLFMD
jgi:hypothetical protein